MNKVMSMSGTHLFILIELITSLIICISCWLLHLRQHFRLQCCNRHYRKPELIARLSGKLTGSDHLGQSTQFPQLRARGSIFSKDTLQHPEDAIQWCLRPIDDEEFDFFPGSFLCYQLFVVFLSLLIFCKFIDHINNTDSSVTLNDYPILSRSSFSQSNDSLFLIDWLLIYGILILINWESLFSFYRYYSTKHTAQCFAFVDPRTIFKIFSCYSIPFIILFMLQIHLYYWLFPLIIMFAALFNIFCTWKTSEILVNQFKQMQSMMENFGGNRNMEEAMVKSVVFMRNSSLLSCICCIIYLSAFLISYNIDILFYLPMIWSVISMAFTLNFIRNRQFITINICRLFMRKPKLKGHGIASSSVVSRINEKHITDDHEQHQTMFRFNNMNTTTATTKTATTSTTITVEEDEDNNNNNDNINDNIDDNNNNDTNNAIPTKLQLHIDNELTTHNLSALRENSSSYRNDQQLQISQNNKNEIHLNASSHIKHKSQSKSITNTNITKHGNTLSVEPSSTFISHQKRASRSTTNTMISKTTIIHFEDDVLYDMDGKEIFIDDEDEEEPFEFDQDDEDEDELQLNEDETIRFYADRISREPSPRGLPAIKHPDITPSNSGQHQVRFTDNLTPRSMVKKVNIAISPKSKSHKKTNSRLPRKLSPRKASKQSDSKSPKNYTASIHRMDSRKRKWRDVQNELMNAKNRWISKFKSIGKKSNDINQDIIDHINNNNDTTVKFQKSFTTKPQKKTVRFTVNTNKKTEDEEYKKHKRAQTELPSMDKQRSHSNPVVLTVTNANNKYRKGYCPGIGGIVCSDSDIENDGNDGDDGDDDLPKMGLNYSDPTQLSLHKKISNHTSSRSVGNGDILNGAKIKKHKHSRTITSRRLVFSKLPQNMQQLPDLQKNKVEQFASLNMMLSLHGFCPKNALFEFQIYQETV